MHSQVYVGDNSHVIEVEDLKDFAGAIQTDAAVNLTALVERDGKKEVSGVTLPITLDHISQGLYRGTIPYEADFEVGRAYQATVKAVGTQGFRAEWLETVIAKRRRA